MAGKLNMAVLMVVVVAALHLQSSKAQTTHTVGGALGWTIPPGGSIAYANWSASQTFTVGDVLVFNYNNGVHDVAEVTNTSFDSCNTNNPISIFTTAPTSITVSSAGEHYYICTFSSHCSLGQKLAINVSAASVSPAPQPATPPPPPPTPTPTPSPVSTPPPTPSPVSTPPPTPSPMSTPPPTPTPSGTPTPSPTATPPSSSTPSPSGSPPPPPTAPSSPPPSSETPPPPPPPPPSSSAPSVAVAAFPVTLLTIALAFLY